MLFRSSNIILKGDLNLNLDRLKFNYITSRFRNSSVLVLRIDAKRFPPGVSNIYPFLIDYFALSDLSEVVFYGEISCLGLLDLEMIYINDDMPSQIITDCHFFYRDFKFFSLNNAFTHFYELSCLIYFIRWMLMKK